MLTLFLTADDTSDSFRGNFNDDDEFIPTVSLNSLTHSLRETIYLANQADTDVVINLLPNATYHLTRRDDGRSFAEDPFFDDLDIRRPVTINGNGATIVGGEFGAFDIFIGGSTYYNVEMNHMRIKDSSGYGVLLQGRMNLFLTDVDFVNNRNVQPDAADDTPGVDARGAALVANTISTVQIVRGKFENNYARGGNGGGADDGDDGQDAGEGLGAAIYGNGTQMTITGTQFINNQATGGVGGFADDDDASGGLGGDSYGGAIFGYNSNFNITGSTFTLNQAGSGAATGGEAQHSGDRAGQGGSASGGAIYVDGGSVLAVSDTTFEENTALGSQGGFGNSNNFYGAGGTAKGGAIYAADSAASLNLQRITFSLNTAIGGNGGEAFFTGGGGNGAEGGAVWSGADGTWDTITFELNGAIGGNGAGGSDGTGGGGGGASAGAALIYEATVSLEGVAFQSNTTRGGKGGDAAPNFARPGGRGGDARGGALRVLGSTSQVTLAPGTEFFLNSVAGGDGGNAGEFNLGTHGDGGDGTGGALISDGGKIIATGTAEANIVFVKNTASGGNAGQPVQGRDNLAQPGRGGSALGGAVFVNAGGNATRGFATTNATFMSNAVTAGMGSSGVTWRDFVGVYRINLDDPRAAAVNPTLYRFGQRSGDSGAAYGGAIFNLGNLDLQSTLLTSNIASGFRGEGDDAVNTPDSGTNSDGTSFPGSRGGDAKGGGVYTVNGNANVVDSIVVDNWAIAGRGGRGGSSYGIQDTVHYHPDGDDPGLISTWRGDSRGGAGGAGGDAVGGGIYAELRSIDTATISNSSLLGNAAIAGRGGDGGTGNSLLDGDYENDIGFGGAGGNGGNAQGGGLFVHGGHANITATTSEKNNSVGGDAGPGGNAALREEHDESGVAPPDLRGGPGGSGGNASGGGASIQYSLATISTSTFAENNVSSGWGGAGGNGVDDPRTNRIGFYPFYNSRGNPLEVFGASGGAGGAGGFAGGGGIDLYYATAHVDISTIAGNRVLSGAGGYGGDGASADWTGGDAGPGGDSRPARGGGIAVGADSELDARSSTLVSNGVQTGGGGLPGLAGRLQLLENPNNSNEPPIITRIPRWTPNVVANYSGDGHPEFIENIPENGGLRINVYDLQGNLIFTDFLATDPRVKVPYGAASVLGNANALQGAGIIGAATDARPSLLFPESLRPATAEEVSYEDIHRQIRANLATLGVSTVSLASEAAQRALRAATIFKYADNGGLATPLAAKLGALALRSESTIVRGLANLGTKLATKTVLTAARTAAKFAGPASIALTVAVELGTVVTFSFIYGKGDFLKGLKIYAQENLLPPDWAMGPDGGPLGTALLFSYPPDEDVDMPTRPPAQHDGALGSNGATPTSEGSNIWVLDINNPSLDGEVTLERTIVSGGVSAIRTQEGQGDGYAYFLELPTANNDVFGPATSLGYNFVSNAAGFTPTASDIVNSGNLNSQGLLGDNGGSTSTIRLNPSSPARNAGPVIAADEVSQNGFIRRAGTQVSIGAWDGVAAELASVPVAGSIGVTFAPGETINVPVVDVLAAASDADGNNLVLERVTRIVLIDRYGNTQIFANPTNAMTAVQGGISLSQADRNQKITFTPPTDFIGRVTFYYTVSNGDKESGEGTIVATSTLTTTTELTTPGPSAYGQNATFTVYVNAGDIPAQGAVQIKVDEVNLGTPVTLDEQGSATITIAGLLPGLHSISAVFVGEPYFTSSQATFFNYPVTTATPTVSVDPINFDFGTALANTQLVGTASAIVNGAPVSVPGTFAFTTVAGSILNAGNQQLQAVTFTPTDTTIFASISSSVVVNVAKADAVVEVIPYDVTYDGSPHTATFTLTGVAADPTAAGVSVVLNTTHTAAGTYSSDTWSLSGGMNYNDIPATTISNLIRRADSGIIIEAVGGVAGAPASVTTIVVGDGGLESSNPSLFAFSYVGINGTAYGPSPTPPIKTGSYSVTAAYPGSANHKPSSGTATFTLTRPPIEYDFGDAPQSYDPANTASHVIGGPLFLGSRVDPEFFNQSSPGATGDDADDFDDEDGVRLAPALIAQRTATAIVTASAAGYLDAWIDFNGNQVFDAAEAIAAQLPLASGTNSVSFQVPASAVTGATFARFRLSSAGGLTPTSPATDGEIEDYAVSITSPAIRTAAIVPDPTIPGLHMLLVNATSAADTILVQPTFVNGVQVGVYIGGGLVGTFPSTSFSRIAIFGNGGNDSIFVNAAITAATTIYGDDGNDTLSGGSGPDTFYPGEGNDTISGNAGDDVIYGSPGNDTVTGGAGFDRFVEMRGAATVTANTSKVGTSTDSFSTIEQLELTGTPGADDFKLTGVNLSVLLDAGDGSDTLVYTGDGNVVLTDSSLTRTQGTAIYTVPLTSIENLRLVGGNGNESFNITQFTKSLILSGGMGVDTLIATNDVDYSLTDSSLRRTDSPLLQHSAFENAQLSGGGSGNRFTLTGWTKTATVYGNGGTDQLVVADNVSTTLSNTLLTRTGRGNITLNSVEAAEISDGSGSNTINAITFTGNLKIDGGAGSDNITGGAGPTLILGGLGNDMIRSGTGRTIQIGGDGLDRLTGGLNDDLLIAGQTAHDANAAALALILAEWASAASYANRVSHLTGLPGGLNGSLRLDGSNVIHDNAVDILLGGAGFDVFFAKQVNQLNSPKDSFADKTLDEFVI